MNKTLKKIFTIALTITTLSVGVTGMTTNAANIGNINLHKYVGAPGSDTVTSQKWNYTTSTSKTVIKISKFKKAYDGTHIRAQIGKNQGGMLYNTGSLEFGGLRIGKNLTATVNLLNLNNSGNYQATGKITG